MEGRSLYFFTAVQIIAVTAVLWVLFTRPGPWDLQRCIGMILVVAGIAGIAAARYQLGKSFSIKPEARQLLTSLKCTTNLERIGDLMMSVAMRVQSRTAKMAASDVRQLVEMSATLREMLDLVYRGFVDLDLECARKVLQMDKDIDHVCHSLFQKHLTEQTSDNNPSGFDVLLMAQALERAGDHTTNLAEDLYSLIEGRSLRHAPKKRAAT